MNASKKILVAVLTVGSVGLAASSVLACHGGSGYGGGYSSSYYRPQYVERVYVKEPVVIAPSFAPAHSMIVVMPGDSGLAICAREYGNSNPWGKVAQFNGMPGNVQLTAGMQLRLPVINPDGSFSMSSAPAAFAAPPQGFAGGLPQGPPQGMPQGFQQGMPQGIAQGMPQGQPGPQGGVQQLNGFAPQGQGFNPQQLPQGLPQGAPMGPQGQPLGQQAQQLGPQGQPLGQQMQQLPPQGPVAPQGPEAGPNNGGPVAQRIAEQLTGMTGEPNGPNAGQPAGPNAGPTDRPLPSIVIGSIMTINGQPLGDARGTVRLMVNGSPVALEIVEWSATSAKVRIPADLPVGLQVQIEILRADGSVVAKDAVQLAAGQKVAAAN